MSDTHPFDPLGPQEITKVCPLYQAKVEYFIHHILGSKSCPRATPWEKLQLSCHHLERTTKAGDDSILGEGTS